MIGFGRIEMFQIADQTTAVIAQPCCVVERSFGIKPQFHPANVLINAFHRQDTCDYFVRPAVIFGSMNIRMPFYVLLLCILSLKVVAQPRKYPVAAVAFYNLENFFNPEDNPETDDEDFTPGGSHRYTEEVFRQKAKNMAGVLAQLGTDLTPDGAALIGICEIEDDRVLKVLVAQPELRQRNYRYIRFDGPDKRGINVGFLYNPKYFRIIKAQPIPVNLKYAGGGLTRDVLLVEGTLQEDTVFVLVNHWPSRSGGEAATDPKRRAAAEVNRQAVSQILARHPHARILIMGDLNDDPVSPSVAKVLGATGNREKARNGALYNPWVKWYENGVGTLCHNDHWNLFDQIILSPAWLQQNTGHWQYYRASVFNRDFLKTAFGKYKGYPHRSYNGNRWINGYSDHFPSIVYLIKDAPQVQED